MSNIQSIKWTGDERELPGIGVVNKGDIVTVPDHVATSYIYQGLAVKLTPTKAKEADK